MFSDQATSTLRTLSTLQTICMYVCMYVCMYGTSVGLSFSVGFVCDDIVDVDRDFPQSIFGVFGYFDYFLSVFVMDCLLYNVV